MCLRICLVVNFKKNNKKTVILALALLSKPLCSSRASQSHEHGSRVDSETILYKSSISFCCQHIIELIQGCFHYKWCFISSVTRKCHELVWTVSLCIYLYLHKSSGMCSPVWPLLSLLFVTSNVVNVETKAYFAVLTFVFCFPLPLLSASYLSFLLLPPPLGFSSVIMNCLSCPCESVQRVCVTMWMID